MRVLVVDDDPASLRAVTALLAGDGIETVGLPDGEAAVEALKREEFDVVVTDLAMPGLNGRDVIRTAREKPSRPPVIVVSDLAPEELRSVGADRILRKPVDYCELVEALNELVPNPQEGTRTFRQLVENIREVFWMTTPDHQQILYVSPAYEEIWGRSRASLYRDPNSWLEAVHADDRARAAEVAHDHGDRGFEVTYRIVRPDGATRWIRDRSFAVRGVEGKVDRVVGTAEDVTELHNTEAQLQQAQKLEAVGRLAGGVAHDFNNLLSVILSYAELMAADLDPAHPMRGDLDEIRTAAQRATGLTRQLLTFSRREISRPRAVDLSATLRSLEKMLRRIVTENVHIAARPESSAAVRVDPGQIEQVIMNLVVNACDAMPGGGTVTIRTRDVVIDDETSREHVGLKPGPYVALTVQDDGIGMDAATKARVFEPFFTTKDASRGTGLGLSTVFGIVEAGGGVVWVDSEPGRGATFHVYLPRYEGDEVPDWHVPPAASGSAKGHETILFVDDDDAVRTVGASILRRSGYRVLDARSASEAVRLFEEHGPAIDLVVTDVVMPHMSGPDLAVALGASRSDLKVLLLSGYTGDALDAHAKAVSTLPLLAKPFTPDALTRMVRELLDV